MASPKEGASVVHAKPDPNAPPRNAEQVVRDLRAIPVPAAPEHARVRPKLPEPPPPRTPPGPAPGNGGMDAATPVPARQPPPPLAPMPKLPRPTESFEYSRGKGGK